MSRMIVQFDVPMTGTEMTQLQQMFSTRGYELLEETSKNGQLKWLYETEPQPEVEKIFWVPVTVSVTFDAGFLDGAIEKDFAEFLSDEINDGLVAYSVENDTFEIDNIVCKVKLGDPEKVGDAK